MTWNKREDKNKLYSQKALKSSLQLLSRCECLFCLRRKRFCLGYAEENMRGEEEDTGSDGIEVQGMCKCEHRYIKTITVILCVLQPQPAIT